MGVHIDEPGRDHASGCVDSLVRINAQIDTNINNVAIVDCDIAAKPGATSPINYAGVLNQ